MRGRVALYGRRHLLQLVAVKRRQADGRSLAEIQAELAGATDATLAAIARVPEGLDRDLDAAPAPARPRFWASAPAALTQASADPAAGRIRPAAAAGAQVEHPPADIPTGTTAEIPAEVAPGIPPRTTAEIPAEVSPGIPPRTTAEI